jgi:hypothetical protein
MSRDGVALEWKTCSININDSDVNAIRAFNPLTADDASRKVGRPYRTLETVGGNPVGLQRRCQALILYGLKP